MSNVEIKQMSGYNFLWIDGYLWMWDIPSEIEIEQDMADQCFGDVLVAGYGMGVIQKMLLGSSKVKSVVTIEVYPEVGSECRKVFGEIHGLVVDGDFYKYYWGRKFDCIVGDIWEEIHPKFVNTYCKFKEHASKFLKPNGKLVSWGMDYYEYLIEKGL